MLELLLLFVCLLQRLEGIGKVLEWLEHEGVIGFHDGHTVFDGVVPLNVKLGHSGFVMAYMTNDLIDDGINGLIFQ